MKHQEPIKFWKAVIHSSSIVSGTISDGMYQFDLPVFLSDDCLYQIAIESFQLNNSISIPYSVESATIPIANTYSSVAQGFRNTMLTTRGSSVFRSITLNTLGLKISTPSALRSALHNIRFVDMAGDVLATSAFGSTPSWVMTFVIYPVGY